MIQKYCSSCQREAWHNMRKDKTYRCTFCGFPITSNPGKREYQEEVRKKQAAKPK